MMRRDSFGRARRRRFVARRAGFVLVLVPILGLVLYVTPVGLTSSPGPESVRPVSPVSAGTLTGPPRALPTQTEQPPQTGQTWDSAIAQDRTPDLASSGKLGTSGGKVSLTFDDGPGPRTTPAILDTLRENGIKATFFVSGRQVEEHPDLLRRIVQEGHTIGNHTYDHANMSQLNPGQMRSELEGTQEAVDEALGYHYPMVLMRPPYGDPYFGGSDALTPFRRVVREQQLIPVIWTIDSQDYQFGGDPRGIVQNVAGQDEAGRREDRDEVILMHDIHPQTVQALPEIIERYRSAGRSFEGVKELLAAKYPGP